MQSRRERDEKSDVDNYYYTIQFLYIIKYSNAFNNWSVDIIKLILNPKDMKVDDWSVIITGCWTSWTSNHLDHIVYVLKPHTNSF